MGKEISLEELSKSSKGANNATKNNTAPVNAAKPTGPVAGGGAMRPIGMADLGKELEALHPEETAAKRAAEEKVNPEIISDAFAALDATVQQKKDNADRMVEQVAEAVEEQQFEQEAAMELGEGGNNGNPSLPHKTVNGTNSTESFEDMENEIERELAEDGDEGEEVEVESGSSQIPIAQPQQQAQEAPKPAPKPTKKNTAPANQTKNDDNDDLDGLLAELDKADEEYNIQDDEEETAEEVRERFKEKMGSIVATKNPINLAEYKIREKPVSASRVLNERNPVDSKKKADWALLYSKRNVTFFECDGPELDALRKTIRNSNGINGVIASLRFIYNHIVDANKPSFEAWTKMIRTEDIESLYFGQYLACYADSNLIARTHEAEACKKTSLIDTDVYKMAKFESDEIKAQFDSIRAMDSTTPTSNIEAQLMQISDDYVISFAPATLYSTFIQYSTLRPEITEKYSDILNTMAYVDQFFTIDRETKELVRMAVKEYPTNINKTVLSKLKIYVGILKTLSTDQYNILTGKLQNIIEDPKLTYVYPAVTCPECGEEIPEEDVDSMLNLLFTRAQLAQIKSL